MTTHLETFGIVLAGLAVGGSCLAEVSGAAPQPATLKDAFRGDFLIGASLNASQFTEQNQPQAALVKAQFNTITPENDLKWGRIHPEPDRYNFDPADRYVAFGESNRMVVIGHTLVWHKQTPPWVFAGADGKPAARDELLARLREHIHTVVGRYRGRITGWDVVNEAVENDGTPRQSPWRKIIGDDYVLKAFQFAHEADPRAELYYNDYSLAKPEKRARVIELIRELQAEGVPVTAVGLQSHHQLDYPTAEQIEATITDFAKLGIKVMITELDVDVLPAASQATGRESHLNPYTNGLPTDVQDKLAARYAELFAVFLRHRDVITRITFWNVTDADSWLNNFPVRGRTNHPLLFDRQGRQKPAFDAVLRVAELAKSQTGRSESDSIQQ